MSDASPSSLNEWLNKPGVREVAADLLWKSADFPHRPDRTQKTFTADVNFSISRSDASVIASLRIEPGDFRKASHFSSCVFKRAKTSWRCAAGIIAVIATIIWCCAVQRPSTRARASSNSAGVIVSSSADGESGDSVAAGPRTNATDSSVVEGK